MDEDLITSKFRLNNLYGRPLFLDIEVEHCRPRFDLTVDDLSLPPQAPVILTNTELHKLQITSNSTSHDMLITPHVHSSNITIHPLDDTHKWSFELLCNTPDTMEKVTFEITDLDKDNPADIAPIDVLIQCI